MKITLESTSKLTTLQTRAGASMPARVWLGRTDSGHEVHAYITRIAVHEDAPPEVMAQFERELQEHAQPTTDMLAIPLRFVL